MSGQTRFPLRTEGMEFEVSIPAVAKSTPNGVQKTDTATGWPMWQLELLVFMGPGQGSAVWSVAVAAPSQPQFGWRDAVEVVDLEIFPWAQLGKDGEIRQAVALRAKEIRPVREHVGA